MKIFRLNALLVTSRRPVSVRLSVCHVRVLYRSEWVKV